jgi:hypothetical protein
MEWDELLETFRFEYWAEFEGAGRPAEWPTFYDWLIRRGKASRFQLSAHGIGREHYEEGLIGNYIITS